MEFEPHLNIELLKTAQGAHPMSQTSLHRSTRVSDLRARAVEMLADGVDSLTFSNFFFAPSGVLCALWKTEAERRAVAASELFQWLQERVSDLEEQEACAQPGRVTIAVPRSLQAGLKREARAEGVSLAELMRLKLGIPYHAMVSPSRRTLSERASRREARVHRGSRTSTPPKRNRSA
ncbi:MAG: hypothetical protein HYZ53_15260 [Planctomycetes bacterium]|nr:hypothetical protein [Planctomycetota bacterium]